MKENGIPRMAIVGGGTASWMTASMLRRLLYPEFSITVGEFEEVDIIGVAEASIPPFHTYNAHLGFDGREFVRATQATFRLGIEVQEWAGPGDFYTNGFGPLGLDLEEQPLRQYWTGALDLAVTKDLGVCCFNAHTARKGGVMPTLVDAPRNTALEDILYACHCDAALCARYLRRLGRQKGRAAPTGGWSWGEFFVDCSRFRGGLIEQCRHARCDDWWNWRPCGRAVVRGRCRASALRRPCRIPARRRGRLKGGGAFRCTIAWAVGTYFRVSL